MAYNCDAFLVCTSYIHEKGRDDHGYERCDCRNPEKLLVLLRLCTVQQVKVLQFLFQFLSSLIIVVRRLIGLPLTMYLATRRKIKQDVDIMIVCQFHCRADMMNECISNYQQGAR